MCVSVVCEREREKGRMSAGGVWQRRAPGRWLLLKLALSASVLALCVRRPLSWLENTE